ncbi:hypothetical protein TRL7639_00588 [Falsiruegeria litorea R37]|uniref:Uncharacterized protein n=1 Tax=Falsiruegeria litorea R37 TaxID=1200284 RepID=A0A1Y5RNX7_9RHOB|nr:hypothetical protein TRL7639_00588 [Falsiruegeria litorea R37]
MTAIDAIRPAKPTINFWHTVSLWPFAMRQAPSCPMPPSDRLARDAGLSPTERELLTLQWPSQTTRHPML